MSDPLIRSALENASNCMACIPLDNDYIPMDEEV